MDRGGYSYLITAKHVLQDEAPHFFSRVFIRSNDKNGGSAFIPIDLKATGPEQNVFVHDDSTVDIAVVPTMPDESVFDFRFVGMNMIHSKDTFRSSKIGPGSDVFFAGLFTAHYGDKINTPIFRFGRVAMLPEDKIRWQEPTKERELVELYLLETMSFGGNSGSPVFFSQGVERELGAIVIGPPKITLAGIMRGNFNERSAGELFQTRNAVIPIFSQNLGIAAVTPAYLLRDILHSEKLKKLRSDHPIKAQ